MTPSFDDERPPRRDNDDDEREKKSWRERDAERNRSRHVVHEKPAAPKAFHAKRDLTVAKKALTELFSGKKNKEQTVAWKKVLEGQGRIFSTRADKYVETFGIPNEWDDLLRLLDHRDAPFVRTVLDKMMDRVMNETPTKKDLLVGKLRVLKIERDEPELVSRFSECLTLLQSAA